jgi:hypothetical protein
MRFYHLVPPSRTFSGFFSASEKGSNHAQAFASDGQFFNWSNELFIFRGTPEPSPS